ncbi:MAG: hypothetical protein IJ429_01085 [Lachnospiraceae bacterium]|nr:hypothetical protein [Lachnospiraceae bacterium]
MINRKIFSEHLIDILSEKKIDAKNGTYIICPQYEEGKKYSSKDDFVRLNVFPIDKISKRVFTFDEIVERFSVLEPLYPLWIDIYISEKKVIELHTSMRFRTPSELKRTERSKQPFKIIE